MNSFSDDDFRDLPPRERRYEVQVSDNLFFAVFPNGVKTWVLVYRFDGLVRRQTLGTFPDMSVAEATAAAAGDSPDAAHEPLPGDGPVSGRRWLLAAASAGLALAGLAAAVLIDDQPDPVERAGIVETPPVTPPAPTPQDARPTPPPADRTSETAAAPPAETGGGVSLPAEDLAAAPNRPLPTAVAIESSPQDVPGARRQLVIQATSLVAAATAPPETDTGNGPEAEDPGVPPADATPAAEDPPASGPPEARRALLALDVVEREPVGEIVGTLAVTPDPQRVYFYTDIRNAAGTEIVHRWLLNGALMAERRFPVRGNYRWRVFSAKDLEPTETGRWRVELLTENGRLLAARGFDYVAAESTADAIAREPAEPPQ